MAQMPTKLPCVEILNFRIQIVHRLSSDMLPKNIGALISYIKCVHIKNFSHTLSLKWQSIQRQRIESIFPGISFVLVRRLSPDLEAQNDQLTEY